MLAARLPGLMPALDLAAAKAPSRCLVVNWSVSNQKILVHAFRQPHHTASAVALVGGGNPPRPGEISRAHQGVLFLDELPEFDRKCSKPARAPGNGTNSLPAPPIKLSFRPNSNSLPR